MISTTSTNDGHTIVSSQEELQTVCAVTVSVEDYEKELIRVTSTHEYP